MAKTDPLRGSIGYKTGLKRNARKNGNIGALVSSGASPHIHRAASAHMVGVINVFCWADRRRWPTVLVFFRRAQMSLCRRPSTSCALLNRRKNGDDDGDRHGYRDEINYKRDKARESKY